MNLYHDERGRFCSRNAMVSRKYALMDAGKYELAEQVDLGLRNADLAADSPLTRKREKKIKKAYAEAVKSGDEQAIISLRKAYYLTDEGIVELQREGRHALAKAAFMRRETLVMADKKEARAQKKPLRLALDLDNTSGDFTDAFREREAAKRGIPLVSAKKHLPDPPHYCFAESGWFNSKTEFIAALRELEKAGGYRKMRAYEGFKRNIQKMVADGDVEVYVVTAREQEWNDDTRAWLRQARVPFKSITHTDDKEKVEGIDVYIDDSDKQIKTLSAHGRTVIAFDNLYNKDINAKYRVSHWDEVPAVIRQISKEKANA